MTDPLNHYQHTCDATAKAYREAAAFVIQDPNLSIPDDAEIEYTDDGLGAYVTAQVWVYADLLEPPTGPSCDVWIAEPDDDATFWEPWRFDQRFTCEDDPDGKGARCSAHEYARYLRRTYPCAFVAVRPAGSRPIPVDH